ncbi:MAG: TolC family protein [Bacteroidia bacterium]|nr:TolC family protein [Bacteroidia bacterium]
MQSKLFFIAVFSLLNISVFAQNNLLSPDSAIAIALKNNYRVQIARNDNEALKNLNSPGFAGMLPQINANASTNSAINNTKQEYSNGLDVDQKNVKADNLTAGVTLVWTLFDGTKMFVTKSKFSEQSFRGDQNLKADIENTIEKIVASYYSIVQQKQILKAIDEELTYSQERLKIAERKFSNGSGSKLDVLQAKTDMNAQRSSQLQQRTRLEEIKNNLNVLLARKPDTEFNVADTVIISYKPQLEQLRTSYEGKNYGLLSAKSNIRISELELKELSSQRYPKINFNGSYLFSKNKNEAGFILLNQNTGFNYGFTATLPLFSGFNLNRQVRNARLNILSSQLEYNNLRAETESSLLIAFREFNDNLQLLNIEEENISLAKERMDITFERFRVGAANSLEVSEAQRTYEEAMSRLASARFNTKLSETALMKLNGDLVTSW